MHVVHRQVAHHDVFHHPLVHFFQGQSATVKKRAIGDGNVTVATVRLSTQFDTSANPVHFLGHTGAIEQRPHLESRHRAVVNQDVLAGYGTFQRVRTFQHDAIIRRCVYLRIAYGNHLAAVYVYAVTVSVDGHIVDGT